MKAIKNMDFFQKISVDNISKPTILGSILSITAILIMSILLLKEFNELLSPKIKKESIVYHDKEQSEKIRVNLSVRLNNVPCYLISVDQEDSIGSHRLDVSDTIHKTRIDKRAHTIRVPYDSNLSEQLIIDNAIETNEGCFIEGYVAVNKVPGNIHISFHKHGELYMWLKFQRPDLYEKILLNHRINAFYFGEYSLKMKILNRFGYNEMTAFNRPEAIPDRLNELTHKSYDYYFKIIPHLFDDKLWDDEYMAYQYSITSKMRDFDAKSMSYEMPVIMMNYDISPITMKITREHKNLLHGLTQICAIVGGVFIIFNLLNRILLMIFESDKVDSKK